LMCYLQEIVGRYFLLVHPVHQFKLSFYRFKYT